MKARKRKHRFPTVKTYGEFLTLLPCCTEAHTKELLEKLSHAKRPTMLCGKEVPADLNTITYGVLDDLSRISSQDDVAARALNILLGLTPMQVYKLNVFDVFGFAYFVKDEVERINNLFASVKPSYSSEEIAAGVKDLSFGTFGVIDWYARRMGITNQDEVFDVAWIRIFTCMKNDNAKNEYEARLHKQHMNKVRRNR